MAQAAARLDPKGVNVKVVVFILSVLVMTVLTMAAIVAVVLVSPQAADGLLILATLAVTVLIYGPLVLGSLTAFWDTRRSAYGRSSFRIWLGVVLGLEAVGVVTIIVWAVFAGAPVWLPVVFSVGAAVLTVLALAIGRWLFRRDKARPMPELAWTPVTQRDITRRIAIVAITFVSVLAIGVIVFAIVGKDTSDVLGMGQQLVFAAQFAFIAAAMACIFVTVRLNRRLRDSTGPGRDLGLVRKLGRVVLRNKSMELTDEEQVAAAKFAAMTAIILPFQLGYLSLLYLGIGLQQVQFLVFGPSSPTSGWLLIAMVAVLVVLVPLYIRRIARARTYATDHAALLPGAGVAQR